MKPWSRPIRDSLICPEKQTKPKASRSPLALFLRLGLAKYLRALLEGLSTLQKARKGIEKCLGNYLGFWRASYFVYVVQEQRNRRGKLHRKARTVWGLRG